MKAYLLTAVALVLLASCGNDTGVSYDPSVATHAPPYVNRISPNNGKAGDVVTIYGFGYSVAAGNNIVAFGSSSTTATAYSLVSPATSNEIESLTVTVPAGVTAGVKNIYVIVFNNTSNADVTFTVNP